MSTSRAQQAESFLPEEPPLVEPLYTVCAGENLVIRVGAMDRKSGVSEVIASCRSRENHELNCTGRWTPNPGGVLPGDNYFPVILPIPRNSPTVVWELHRIILRDREGNRKRYVAGIDFEEMLFRVEGVEGIDCTPPRLLGVRFGRA